MNFAKPFLLALALFALATALMAEDAAAALSSTAETYEVTAQRPGRTASRMDVAAKDVPATINVITAEDLRKRNSNEWVSALQYTAGVMPIFTYGGFNSATVRGMSENDLVVLLDGVRDDTYNQAWSSPQSNLAGFESIEVLKGPNSLLYGTGALAGVINRVRKQPSARPAYELSAGTGSFESKQVFLGATGPLADLPLNYRFDFGFTRQEGFRHAPERRASGNLALEWEPLKGSKATWRSTVSRDRYDRPDPGMPIDPDYNRVPSDAPLDKNYGGTADFLDFKGDFHSLDLRQELGAFYVSNKASFSAMDYEYLEAEALDLGADNRTITRDYLYFNKHHRPWLEQLELGWNTDGAIQQHGLVGYDFHVINSTIESDSALDYSGFAISTIDLYEPENRPQMVLPRPDGRRNVKQTTHSIYAQDMAAFADGMFKVLAAVRYDSFEKSQSADALDPDSQYTLSQGYVTKTTGSAVTYRGGLVYSPFKTLSLYASASTAFKPIIVVDSADGKVDWLPEMGRMFEVGAKWEGEGGSSASIAYFDILKTNVLVRRSNSPRTYSQDGEKTSRGFETELKGKLSERVTVKGGYSYVDASLSRFNIARGVFIYGRPYVVPMHTANLWADLGINNQFSLGLGGRFVGDQYADEIDNNVLMPWYAVADAGIYYKKGPWGVDLVANNIFDQRRYFVSTITGNNPQLYPGSPLQLSLTGRYSF